MPTMKGPFAEFAILYRLGLRVEARLPIRIGRGRETGSVAEPDLPVLKNADDRPIIPGSTLKGFFRANAQRLLASIPKLQAKDILDQVFGSPKTHASSIFFGDLTATEERVLEARKHISIDPETGGARPGRLFEVELVKAGTVFQGRNLIIRNLAPSYLGLLYAVKALANDGIVRIGGFKSRGYGAIGITFSDVTIVLPGTSMESLRTGRSCSSLVGSNLPVTISCRDIQQVTLKEGDLTPISFSAKIAPDAQYLGVRIEVADSEALLLQLVQNLQTHLTRSGGTS